MREMFSFENELIKKYRQILVLSLCKLSVCVCVCVFSFIIKTHNIFDMIN